jgi:hypothetical protein
LLGAYAAGKPKPEAGAGLLHDFQLAGSLCCRAVKADGGSDSGAIVCSLLESGAPGSANGKRAAFSDEEKALHVRGKPLEGKTL